jgi:hypothetical protein
MLLEIYSELHEHLQHSEIFSRNEVCSPVYVILFSFAFSFCQGQQALSLNTAVISNSRTIFV